ncbi:MAG: VWA domain-containing protein [Bacillus sp. (in: Bacteria)]|nr:VWA domain-containing protein [Bacillus sp. (in: firmicutes)]
MRRTKLASKFLIVLFLLILLVPIQIKAATAAPAVNFTVTPSQSVIVKPSTGVAQGSLDVRLTPVGKATNANRTPVDVVFVFDKSGSMDELGKNPSKFQSAKDAVAEAVNIFGTNPNYNDRFALIPFSSDVETDKIVNFPIKGSNVLNNVNTNLKEIQNKANSLTAYGGTNYTQSIQKANAFLTSGNNNEGKYVIFLTDGEPTSLIQKETFEDTKKVCIRSFFGICIEYESKKVSVEDNVTYTIYTNNTATATRSDGTVISRDLNNIQKAINASINSEVNKLAANNIKLYSIGFGTDKEVDMNYLRKLSEITGVTAQQASTNTISKIFEDISQKVATPTISTTIKINASKYGSKVKLADNANATTDSAGDILIKKDILFPINQEPSGAIDMSLPLTFSEAGTYVFDNIVMQYKDLDGNTQTKYTSATIQVKADAPASFSSTMTLKKEVNELNDLIKTSNSDDKTNYFNVEYILNPIGIVNNSVSGKLTQLVIEQPLSDSVSLVSADNVKEINKNGLRYAVITLPNEVNYSGGKFTPSVITKTIQYKVNYAVNNLSMPRADLYFKDSRFTNTNETTISPSTQTMNMKVQLKESTVNNYIGDAAGIIEKREQETNKKLANTEFPNDYNLANKPVKDMVFEKGSNDQTIEITYSDNSIAYLHFLPDFELIGQDTSTIYKSGSTSTEFIDAVLTNKVPGHDVAYAYKIDNASNSTGWKTFKPEAKISIETAGENTISIKASGGFANNTEIVKKIKIAWSITSITIEPNPLEVNVGGTKNFTIKVEPSNASNMNLDISMANPSISSLIPGQNTITGNIAGNTELIVKTTDGSNIVQRIPVRVMDPYVKLDDISFTKPVYTIERSDGTNPDLIAVEDLLLFHPSNATDKDIEEVLTNASDTVEVIKQGDQYYLKAKDVGYAEITAIAEKQKDGTQPKDSTLFKVVKKRSEEGGDGRW